MFGVHRMPPLASSQIVTSCNKPGATKNNHIVSPFLGLLRKQKFWVKDSRNWTKRLKITQDLYSQKKGKQKTWDFLAISGHRSESTHFARLEDGTGARIYLFEANEHEKVLATLFLRITGFQRQENVSQSFLGGDVRWIKCALTTY